jgi:poly-gamma-glutamate synthesis protein (capsule biosynthesis protein)
MNVSTKTIFILPILVLCACIGAPPPQDSDNRDDSPETPEIIEEIIVPIPVQVDYITIVAVGDNLIHDPILKEGLKDGVYNFEKMYDKVRDYILPADIAFINQETVLGSSSMGYTGYPLFCSPVEIGAAVAAAGFNIINHANNHVMDRGEAGIRSSLDYWDSHTHIEYLGIHRSEEERMNRKVIVDKNNFKIGFLAYTYGTNGIPLPRGKSWLASLIEPEKIAADIDALRPLCDYLVVSMHWGDEYKFAYNKEQENLARLLAEHQVDLVIGHHPHVLEPYAAMERPDGGTMEIFYSLGNFLATHVTPNKDTLMGGIMYLKLKKTEGVISIEEIGLIPVISHFDASLSNICIYPLSEYTADLAAKHWNRTRDREVTLDFFEKKAEELFGSLLLNKNPFTP